MWVLDATSAQQWQKNAKGKAVNFSVSYCGRIWSWQVLTDLSRILQRRSFLNQRFTTVTPELKLNSRLERTKK
jgi:hypothetical protein